MKCVRCNRLITAAAIWVGGNAIGPKCAQIMGLMQTTRRNATTSPTKMVYSMNWRVNHAKQNEPR